MSNTLFRGFAVALGLEENTFLKRVSTPPNQLRLLHYFKTGETTDDVPGIGAHTDYECFTILLPTAPGLEVRNDLGEWIDAPLIDGAFVINIGDMMEVMSNGRFVATSHRVRRVNEERYAFPMFCSMDYDVEVSPLENLVNKENPAKYNTIHCGNHLYSQTIQTFNYLKKRFENGELQLPPGVPDVAAFLRD